jgi:hypothetical protein
LCTHHHTIFEHLLDRRVDRETRDPCDRAHADHVVIGPHRQTTSKSDTINRAIRDRSKPVMLHFFRVGFDAA